MRRPGFQKTVAEQVAAALQGVGGGRLRQPYPGCGAQDVRLLQQRLNHYEQVQVEAAQIQGLAGRRIAFHDASEEQMAEGLRQAGMPPWQVDGLLEDYAHYRRGEAAEIATGVEDATKVPPRRFQDFARDYASAF